MTIVKFIVVLSLVLQMLQVTVLQTTTSTTRTGIGGIAAAFSVVENAALGRRRRRRRTRRPLPAVRATIKEDLLDSLDRLDGTIINESTTERTRLVDALAETNPTRNPGSLKGFGPIAPGTWSIIYAPHIYFGSQAIRMMNINGKENDSNNNSNKNDPNIDSTFDSRGGLGPVLYILRPDRTMTSHARYDVVIAVPSLPQLRFHGWLSVSGTYGSEDNAMTCRVDFDRAWVKHYFSILSNNENTHDGATSDHTLDEDDDRPYESFEDVPDSMSKNVIQVIGQAGFVKSVSVFPVSYLDDDTIVFDFELLKTRICAKKIAS